MTSTLGNKILGEFDKLRELEPIHWSDNSHGWLVTRHADVDDALQGKFPLSLRRVEMMIFGGLSPEQQAQLPLLRRYIRHWPVEMDGPEHTRLRKLLVKAFNKKVVDATLPFISERVGVLVDALEREPVVEFNEEIARQLPGSVILKLMGLPQEYLPRLRDWANAFQEGVSVPYADMDAKLRAEQAMQEMTEVFTAEIARRRQGALQGNDLISSLLAAKEEGNGMSDDEVVGALQLAIIAGHDTTGATLTMGLATLIEHPEVWQHMYQHPEKTLESCLELMRYMAMSAAQPRVVAEDFEWHGKQLHKGEFVWLIFAAANRDPRVFSDPASMDPARNNERSMVFAPGMHHCIGHLLAKAQVTQLFGELVRRFEGADLLDPELSFMPQIVFRGLNHLNVRMRPRVV
ncbi:cytochrome P450 [Massilia cavernae]|uniref:Cytochrome P450 n=2 Tax=Massilia cavernae TaxID=2320864 RepID=A0A418X6Y9_9BURK|nr:cytochrome P450 [Massilia cavernae]